VKQSGLAGADPDSTLYQAEAQVTFVAVVAGGSRVGRPETLIGPVSDTLQQLNPTQPLRDGPHDGNRLSMNRSRTVV